MVELEYLLHQIDNGNDFDQIDGFEIIFKIIENSITQNHVIGAARVITAAVQANPKGNRKVHMWAYPKTTIIPARKAVHKIGGVSRLVSQISKFSNFSDENSEIELKSLIGSLSALIRDFPAAQTDFINLNGEQILLQQVGHVSSINTKITTLFADLCK